MDFNDIPIPDIPFPKCYADAIRPIIVTKEYYDELPEHEKAQYEPINKKEAGK